MEGKPEVTAAKVARRRAWWILSILVVAILASLAGIFFGYLSSARRRIEAERPVLVRRTDELRARRVLRPVFFEPEEEGNGWPLLVRAVEGIAAVPAAELAAFPLLNEEEGARVKPEEAERVLARIAPFLENLKAALRRRWTEPDYRYEDHVRMKTLNLGDVIKVSRVLRDAAVLRHDARRFDESADFVILGLGLGDRIATKGQVIHHLVSVVIQSIAKSALSEELLSRYRFDGSSLARLHRAFEVAGASRPVLMESLRTEDLVQRLLAVDFATRGAAAMDEFAGPDKLSTSMSAELMAAKFLHVQDRFMAEVERLAGRPFEERQEGLKALVEETKKAPSPLHKLLVVQVARPFVNDRSMEVEFALVRAAIGVARYQVDRSGWPTAWADLVPGYLASIPLDPVGSHPLGLVFKDGAAVIYSWGGDGKDDEGDPALDFDADLPGDIVLKVKPGEVPVPEKK